MTMAELDRWTIQSKWGEARRNWLRLYLEPFVVMPYNRALWANVEAPEARRRAEFRDPNRRLPDSVPRDPFRHTQGAASRPNDEALRGGL